MCLLAVAFQTSPDFPVLLAANREEAYRRPATLPTRQQDRKDWLGGVDQVAGGTWLGINDEALIVAVTNRPKAEGAPTRSRGLLCRDLLSAHDVPSALQRFHDLVARDRYAGFNLLLIDGERAVIIEAGDGFQMHDLSPGFTCLTNGPFDPAADIRCRHVLESWQDAQPRTAQEWIAWSSQICPQHAHDDDPAICLHGSQGGTVSSSVIALGAVAEQSHYLHAAGPPCEMPFRDYSEAVRMLIEDPASQIAPATEAPFSPDSADAPASAGASLHRMHLKGPWQFAPVSSDSGSTLPEAGRVRMPAAWRSFLGEFKGCVRFARPFHKPTNLDPHERVFLSFTDVRGSARVMLDDQLLGEIPAEVGTGRFEITPLLQQRHELFIDLNGGPDGARPVWEAVAIEIES